MKPFPLNKVFTLLESSPVIMITTADENKQNVMTLSWLMPLDFLPRFAFTTGPWNYSYEALMKTKECVVAIPLAPLAKTVVEVGSCSGKEINKFENFNLTPLKAELVKAPLVKECYANLECKIVDHLEQHDIFVVECIKAWIDEDVENPCFFHAIGDGRFVVDGEKMNFREIMIDKIPDGV